MKQGDCVSSIAEREGFFWETVWLAPENSDLRNERQDPNLLVPGDKLTIPDKDLTPEQAAADESHVFVRKGVPAMFRVVVEVDDQPLANTSYKITIDGRTTQGETDDTGLVEVPIAPDARRAKLVVGEFVYDFVFGSLDPVTEPTGLQARLQNLGFYDFAIDGVLGPRTEDAIREFQAFADIEPTGVADQATLDALVARQDEPHEAAPDDPDDDEDEPAAESDGRPEDYESLDDSDDDTGDEDADELDDDDYEDDGQEDEEFELLDDDSDDEA